jgi:DNA-binding transcriptional MerR regulator
MDDGDGLLRIGLFSRLATISVRMLRYYQEQAVLEPAVVDGFSGHRFYRPEQIVDAHWVVRLREAGLPVAEIRQVLAHRDDPGRLREVMNVHRERLAADRALLDGKSAAFARIATYLEESTMNINPRQEHLPAMTVAALRRILPGYDDEGVLWQEIGDLMARSGAAMPEHDRGLGGATFHDTDYRESDVDVEVWLQVETPFGPVAPLTCQQVPEQEVVIATLTGSYDGMPELTAAIGSYIGANRLRTGPMFNIYRVSPVQTPDPAAWVTDVCFPILDRATP